jgi:hypothetical protein
MGGGPSPLLRPRMYFDEEHLASYEEQLAGGIANLWKVVRIGDTVRRPASANADGLRYMLTMVG